MVLEPELSWQGQRHQDWKIAEDPAFFFQRTIDLEYVRLPFYYKHIYKTNKKKLQFYFNVGIYTAFLKDANLTYFRGGRGTDFVAALTEKNEYADQIYQPDNYRELFEWLDAGILTGWGIQTKIYDNLVFNCDIRSEMGVSDINDIDWRFPHPIRGYKASRNHLIGIKVGIAYQF